MEAFETALAAIEQLKREGVIDEYAIGGAMALVFWTEPTTTYDVDVFVLMQSSGIIFSLEPIYAWAARHRYPVKAEHIVVAGVPIQTIPAHNALTIEAVKTAAELRYGVQPVRVIRPEYLIAMALDGSARSAKRMTRVAALLEDAQIDRGLLTELQARYNLVLPANDELHDR